MYVTEISTGKIHKAIIELVTDEDYKSILKSTFFFNWKTEKDLSVYKLRINSDKSILGLMSLIYNEPEKRIEIHLLAVSKKNRGKQKQFDRIAGTLIGFACREAKKHYGIDACVSFVPKTNLKKHYIQKYDMSDAGKQVFLAGLPLLRLLNEYVT